MNPIAGEIIISAILTVQFFLALFYQMGEYNDPKKGTLGLVWMGMSFTALLLWVLLMKNFTLVPLV